MQAIRTRILPATNTKPQRIKATSCSGISITLSLSDIEWQRGYDYQRAAVKALADKLGWHGKMALGGLDDNGDCVAVFVTKETTFNV